LNVYLIKIDAISKLIRKFKVTGASEHNSKAIDDLLYEDDKGEGFNGVLPKSWRNWITLI
jgi:hypothetical protein